MRSTVIQAVYTAVTFSSIIIAVQSSDIYTRTVCEFETLAIECAPEQSIKIVDVFYGRSKENTYCLVNSNSKNVQCNSPASSKTLVEQRCNYKQECQIPAQNDFFGDPCIGTLKHLTISFMCIKDIYTSTACEFETLAIGCLPEQSIKIVDVFYGRNTQCTCHDNNNSNNVQCNSSNKSKTLVEQRCNYKQECQIPANNDFFGDPCFGTFKYLTISFMCLKEPYESSIFCEGDKAQITCSIDKQIVIHSAHYGRSVRNPCACVRPNIPTRKTACHSNPTITTSFVASRCEGFNNCTFTAALQEDPCPNIFKLMEINYFCL